MSFAGLSFLPRLAATPFPRSAQSVFRRTFSRLPQSPKAIAIPRTLPRASPNARLPLYTLGLGLSFITLSSLSRPVLCEAPFSTTSSSTPALNSRDASYGQEPASDSILSVYQLSFGAVCGICSGVFLKKGLKAIAFLLGGVFVLLQYMSSKSYISVDWARLSSRYDSTFGTKTTAGGSRAPTVGGVWQAFVDFLTANFQQRASFLAGFALGMRLG